RKQDPSPRWHGKPKAVGPRRPQMNTTGPGTPTKVAVRAHAGSLHLSVRDDGLGGAVAGTGSGLIGLIDRVEALGGKISVTSHPGQGTALLADLPVESR
ncbi:MAG: hypothetical protein QOE32_5640, partial [Pseudonocardiales bacterium]|nr:hypothetical protein [Pseudonocardiales bacterium]